ncbi:hypothetical protein GCM10009789_05120 [Kribbella sancticallisti]|uniref:HD domain-containing protein n=1 Tax=Kribbella sancticallisti TaxID=460087 RepID=A0ABN2C8S3_9ACTN
MTDETTDRDASGVVAFGNELGVLKGLRQTGWWQAGAGDPESMAEHSRRVAQLAALIAVEEGGDPARALRSCGTISPPNHRPLVARRRRNISSISTDSSSLGVRMRTASSYSGHSS